MKRRRRNPTQYPFYPRRSNSQDIEFVIETEPGKRAAPPPYIFHLLFVDNRSAQPFALRLTSQSRPAATSEKSTSSTANQIKAGTPSYPIFY